MRETYSWNMKPVELAVVVALNVKPKKLTQLEIGRMEYNYLVISHRLRCRLDQELTLSVYCAYIILNFQNIYRTIKNRFRPNDSWDTWQR